MPSAVFYESKKHSGLELFRQLPARTTTSTRMKSCISKYAAVDYAHVKVERECIRHVEKLGMNKPLGERLLRDQIMQGLYDKDTANMCLTWGVGERGGSNIKSSGPENQWKTADLGAQVGGRREARPRNHIGLHGWRRAEK